MQCGAALCGVVDPDLRRASELAAAGGADMFARVDELPWSSIDAVFICTPPAYRREPIALAVQYGVDVFVEKPLALDARAGNELAALVDGVPIESAVGYMNRYRPGVVLAQEFARSEGFIGLSMAWAGKRYGVPWWALAEQSGGPINEQATHLIDLLRYLRGEVGHVHSISNTAETRLALAAEFEDGGIATLLYTCEAPEKVISIQLLTQRGHLTLSGWDFVAVENTIDGRLPAGDVSPFQIETEAFLNGEIRSDFGDASRTQALVERVRSAAFVA
jgi:predicted dehydrogenase